MTTTTRTKTQEQVIEYVRSQIESHSMMQQFPADYDFAEWEVTDIDYGKVEVKARIARKDARLFSGQVWQIFIGKRGGLTSYEGDNFTRRTGSRTFIAYRWV